MSRASGSDNPEDVDATFAEIVADLRAEGIGRITEEPAKPASPPAESGGNQKQQQQQPQPPAESTGWRDAGRDWEDTMFGDHPVLGDDEHFVPPDPPPLPKPRKGAFVVLALFLLGLLLLIAPGLIGLATTVATPLGILSLAAGLALLLLRVRQGPPDGADPTNGAQL